MYELAFPLLVGLVILALAFDFLNGLHDAANSIATVVATRLLRPVQAVLFAAFFNFAAYFLSLAFPALHKVAETIGAGLIDKNLVTPHGRVRRAGRGDVLECRDLDEGHPFLVEPCARRGYRRGFYVAHAGFEGIQWTGLNKTVIAIFLSPLLGMVLAMLVMLVSSWALHRVTAKFAESSFRYLHLFSSAAYSLSHGLNDAQKTMGVITVLLYSTGYLTGEFHVPHWVAIACYIAIGLGTLSGGWKIIETMGGRITKLSHHQGFAASTGGSIMVFAASLLGIPVSTTHTITGSIIGAGVARRASAVRWGVASNVVVAWFITIPASAVVAALFYAITRLF